ncbi:MAG: molybdenum cofactor biosynthesis protein MoaE, partial [Nitriliruptoraceae bacterium]
TVRDHAPDLGDVVGLEYSAYPAMAERELMTIADDIAQQHSAITGIALVHAVGDLAVGDHTILVACVSPHRAQAFDACRDALEEVKRRAPIWKRERTRDGMSRWVGL